MVLVDLDAQALADTAGEIARDRVVTAIGDVCDLASMQAAVADRASTPSGSIDVVVANAGIASYGSVLAVDPQAFKRVIDVNVTGVFHTVRAALPHVIERRGYVLVVGSLASYVAGARAGRLPRVQGRRRALRQRAAPRGRPPRGQGRLGPHVVDRHAAGPGRQGRPVGVQPDGRRAAGPDEHAPRRWTPARRPSCAASSGAARASTCPAGWARSAG